MPRELHVVLAEWEDSVQVDSSWQWLDEADYPPIVICRSVGWLLHRDERQLTLAVSIGGKESREQVSGVITIPARAVVKIDRLSNDPSLGVPSSEASACQEAV